ncbi:hypothetical protein ACFY64_40310 [Streptomyces collinus]|uniref:hypothetical protein n=1 Tax=Streptomyces collinus TaxID=42684 RepID=UPI00367C57BD
MKTGQTLEVAAAVIGKEGRDLTPQQARDHVIGGAWPWPLDQREQELVVSGRVSGPRR